MLSPDYAQFTLEKGHVNPGPRMIKKLTALPFSESFEGKTVLDVGCDYGQFSFMLASMGAKVLGLDRNRKVNGNFVDLIELNKQNAKQYEFDCDFEQINLGKSWKEFGKFDIILMLSCYHHIYENCGDHKPIWLWLWRHCGECVIWENPVDNTDQVVQMNVTKEYSKNAILDAAHIYFDSEYIGPALHEPNRHVYVFRPKKMITYYKIAPKDGIGGATKAFLYDNQRRMKEIEAIVGYLPFPGSLNCKTDRDFDFSQHYYTGSILDVKERGQRLDQEYILRETRFYPIWISGVKAHIMKMRGEAYDPDFIEIIAKVKLRARPDLLSATGISLCE